MLEKLFLSALKARDVQRRGTILCGLADHRARLEKQPGDVEVALPARNDQRRGAIGLGLVDRRTGLAQQPGDLEVALLARDVQRCDAVLLGLNPSSCYRAASQLVERNSSPPSDDLLSAP